MHVDATFMCDTIQCGRDQGSHGIFITELAKIYTAKTC